MYIVKRTVYAVPNFKCAVFKVDFAGEETLVGWFCDVDQAELICEILNASAHVALSQVA